MTWSHECETVTTRGFFNQDDYYNQSQDIDVALPSTPSLSPERTLDNRYIYLVQTNCGVEKQLSTERSN